MVGIKGFLIVECHSDGATYTSIKPVICTDDESNALKIAEELAKRLPCFRMAYPNADVPNPQLGGGYQVMPVNLSQFLTPFDRQKIVSSYFDGLAESSPTGD
jgi:hypothetical protein